MNWMDNEAKYSHEIRFAVLTMTISNLIDKTEINFC